MNAQGMNGRLRWFMAMAGLLAGAALLGGCMVGPAYKSPEVPMPADWTAARADARWPPLDWWSAFQDPTLDQLVSQALAHNHELLAALERVDQAQAMLRVAGAARYPWLDAAGQFGRQKASKNAGANNSSRESAGTTDNFYQLGLSASYEIDLFGANRAALRAAAANLQVSEFDRRTMALGVAAATVSTYFEVAALEARLGVAQEELANAQSMLKLIRIQQQGGMATALQAAQQQLEIATIQAMIPGLETQRQQASNALALLVGRLPQGFAPRAHAMEALHVPQTPAGLPSVLLARRPDIGSAAAALASANAQVRVATAALLPRLTSPPRGAMPAPPCISSSSPAVFFIRWRRGLPPQSSRGAGCAVSSPTPRRATASWRRITSSAC